MKRLILTAITFAMVLSLSACGSSDSNLPTEPSKPSEATQTTTQSSKPVSSNSKKGFPDQILNNALNTGYFASAAISDKARSIHDNNPQLFPSDPSAYRDFVDTSLQYRHLTKDVQAVGDTLFQVSGTVLVIYTNEIDGLGKLTEFQIMDDNWDNFYVIYYGDLPDVFAEDYITVTALPYSLVSFANTNGGVTQAVFAIAADVDKQ